MTKQEIQIDIDKINDMMISDSNYIIESEERLSQMEYDADKSSLYNLIERNVKFKKENIIRMAEIVEAMTEVLLTK